MQVIERHISRKTFLIGAIVCLLGLSSIALIAHAATISDVTITGVTTNSANISWTTDINTDATVNYGVDANVGIVRDATFNNKDHSLTLPMLDPATTYHLRVVSTDQNGNKSATAGFVFTTRGSQADKAIADIKKITDPAAILQVADALQQVATDVILPPSIIGEPKVTVGQDHATVEWSTDREAGSVVELATDGDYSSTAKDPYNITQGNANASEKEHSVDVIGLNPATEYHFRVSSQDSVGLTGVSDDFTFTTTALLPAVNNVKVGRITESSATITWDTGTVLAKGVVNYTNLRTKATQSLGNPVYLTKQAVTLTGLELGTRYQGTVTATNQTGDNVESQSFTFITSRDVTAPLISSVNNQSTLFADDDSKVQTILSWTTDKPTFCQVFYVLGLVKDGGAATQSIAAESNPVTNHLQVMTGFTPGSVYKFWIQCHDSEGNQAQSDDYVLITPVQAKNIIDLILANFQGTFGWVGKVGK